MPSTRAKGLPYSNHSRFNTYIFIVGINYNTTEGEIAKIIITRQCLSLKFWVCKALVG